MTTQLFKDYFRLLELPPSASEAAIHRRYSALMRALHPNGKESSTAYEVFHSQELAEAYSVLQDPIKRREYTEKWKKERKWCADRLRVDANECYRKELYTEAIALYSEAMIIDASNPVLFSNRSMSYGGLGDWVSARNDAERAVELGPLYSKGYYNLVRSLVRMGHEGLGDELLQLAKKKFPGDPDIDKLSIAFEEYIKQRKNKNEKCTPPLFGPIHEKEEISRFLLPPPPSTPPELIPSSSDPFVILPPLPPSQAVPPPSLPTRSHHSVKPLSRERPKSYRTHRWMKSSSEEECGLVAQTDFESMITHFELPRAPSPPVLTSEDAELIVEYEIS